MVLAVTLPIFNVLSNLVGSLSVEVTIKVHAHGTQQSEYTSLKSTAFQTTVSDRSKTYSGL